jgi:hypothetical protein
VRARDLSYHDLPVALNNFSLHMTRDIVQLISFLCELFDLSCHDLESCGINILDLIRFVDKGFAFVLARS